MKFMVRQEFIENILTAAMGAFFTYFVTIIVFEAEGKYKAEATIITMPYTRREIVIAKYMVIFLGSIAYYSLNMIVMEIFVGRGMGTFSEEGILYGIGLSLIFQGIMIPFFMKFEYVKAANIMMLGIMTWGAGFVIFTKKIVSFIDLTNRITTINPYLFLLISVIIILISCLTSVKIYEQKELI
jgi:ABC-2 type transport system permease protein